MKIDKGKIESQQLKLTLEVDNDEINNHLQKASAKLSNRLKIPGFRKGKAPMSIIEQIVGIEGIVEESLEHAVPDLVNKAIQEENIEFFSTPKVSIIDLQPKLKLEALIALKPITELLNLEKIKVDVEKEKVSAKEVNKVIDEIRDQNGTWAPVSRKAAIGDLVTIDFKCDVDDEEVMNHSSIDLLLDLKFEENLKMPGLMKKISGMEKNKKKKFNIELPDDYLSEKFRNKTAEYNVQLHEIKEKELPEIDDSFAKIVDPNVEDLKGLKKLIKTNLQTTADNKWDQELWDEYIKQAVDSSKFTIAELMVEQETNALIDQQKEMIKNQKIEFDDYLKQIDQTEETFEEELKIAAENRIKRALVIEEVMTHYEIEVQEEKVQEEMEKWKKQQNNSQFTEEQVSGEIKYSLKREKLLEKIKDIALK
ncbi:MAG: trigger factor [Dehalococcoidia bacterium]|nr:trigger factor [Dehalococcoidia bacterium]